MIVASYQKYVLQMNYAKAAKRPKTRTFMSNILQSKAEIEFGFELSTVEVSRLLKRFSIDYVFDVTEKVCKLLTLNFSLILFSTVWFWIPAVSAISV